MGNGEFNTRLAACSEIRTGQTFKKPWEEYPKGNLVVLLPKDILDGQIITEPIKVNEQEVSSLQNHLLRKGEILIANKGSKFNTFLYNGSPSPAIATTAFYIVTPCNGLMPEYLNWYLNQKEAKEYLSLNSTGSVIPTITKAILSDLPIPLIPLKEQQYIYEFIIESTAEQLCLKNLLTKKEELMESFVWEHIQQHIR